MGILDSWTSHMVLVRVIYGVGIYWELLIKFSYYPHETLCAIRLFSKLPTIFG